MKRLNFILIILLAASLIGIAGCKKKSVAKVKPAPLATHQAGQK